MSKPLRAIETKLVTIWGVDAWRLAVLLTPSGRAKTGCPLINTLLLNNPGNTDS